MPPNPRWPPVARPPRIGGDPVRDHRHRLLRILYVVNDLALGGAQRVVVDQARVLNRSRFEPVVASLEIDPRGELIAPLEAAGIPVHRLRRRPEFALAGTIRLAALVRRLRPDLVHTHLAAAGVVGRCVADRERVPRIATTLHNLSDWEENRWTPLRWLDRQTLPLADRVIAVSDAVCDAFARTMPALAGRAVTVRNGVAVEDLAAARRERLAARAALRYAADDFVVGTVARFDPRKGLDTLIEAFAPAAGHDPRLRLLLIGDGPERQRLRRLVSDRGVTERVQMIHRETGVGRHIAAMDLFAAPSRTEGLGVAIIEALAVGVPVLGSRVGGIPEVVMDGSCGRLLPPGRPEIWAASLTDLARRPPELERWARAAALRAHSFSLEASGHELERIYTGLLGIEETTRDEAQAA